LNIIIPIKQVPETSRVKMDPETGTMIREGVESIINPLDLYAIEIGIRFAETRGSFDPAQGRRINGGKTTVLSMGPAKAEDALREAVAMGCDEAVLLSHRAFAGSDTWATSYALSRAIRKLAPYDLILCGERATDGDTGQVGPGIAAWLDIPVATYISRILEFRETSLLVKRLVEDGYETLEIETPCLLTVVKEAADPRMPTLRGKQRARKIAVPVWGPDEIGADAADIGLKGSPTRVVKIESPRVARDGDIRTPKDPAELETAVDGIVAYLEKLDLL
jgi:electron transfer flavoprotein beta subunit